MSSAPILYVVYEYLKKGYEIYETIEKFSNKMVEILENVGDIHYDTAIEFLKDVAYRKSNKPEREFNQAIQSLRTAYNFFINAGDKAKILRSDEYNGKGTNYLKAFETALVITICYIKSEEHELAKDYLLKAKSCFNIYASNALKAGVADDVNGFNIISMARILINPNSSSAKKISEVLDEQKQQLNSILTIYNIEKIKSLKPN